MVDVIFRGGADMAIRRIGCCDCILRGRCRWWGGGGRALALAIWGGLL
jgi:hypothetical protein